MNGLSSSPNTPRNAPGWASQALRSARPLGTSRPRPRKMRHATCREMSGGGWRESGKQCLCAPSRRRPPLATTHHTFHDKSLRSSWMVWRSRCRTDRLTPSGRELPKAVHAFPTPSPGASGELRRLIGDMSCARGLINPGLTPRLMTPRANATRATRGKQDASATQNANEYYREPPELHCRAHRSSWACGLFC